MNAKIFAHAKESSPQGRKNIGTAVSVVLRKVWDSKEGFRSIATLANRNSLYEFLAKGNLIDVRSSL